MARIRVITDSGSDIPDDVARRLGVDVVPLTIRFGDDEYTDRLDLSPSQFWAKCKESKVLPETAAPSPGSFQAAYESAAANGYDGVLVLTISAALSATHQSATLAAEAVADLIPVRVVDTKAVSMAVGLMAIDLGELAASGADLDGLETRARQLLERVGICGTLDTLEHLVKGGRIGGARALLGQVLAIKPLLALKDGVVAEAGRQRTRAKSLAAVASVVRANAPFERLSIVHGDASDVDDLVAMIADVATEQTLVVTDVGPVVGTHGGPRIIAACWIKA